MVSTIQNTDVKQKEADRAVVVAVTSRRCFDCGADDGDEVCEVGVAFPLLQALQRVNERLEISRFCFFQRGGFHRELLKNNGHLFLTADRDEAAQASQKLRRSSSELCFCGDAVIRTDAEPPSASQDAAQSFWAQLGEMRRRFGMLDSPLSLVLLTSRGGRESCGTALQTLRSRGVNMDEAYSLAGAPRSPILSLLRPHFLLINHLQD
ncbi:hypothetical protein KUCAC02_007125 [Chaenocephalus aceratus]|nr:hypothetical protein KUCAC02_007125 [Chaenocephalus aceratus]